MQLERYRSAGKGASLVERTSRRLVVELDQRVDASLVDAAIAVERECCPFFALDWQPPTRRLSIAVADAEHEPALDGIAFALGFGELAGRTTPD